MAKKDNKGEKPVKTKVSWEDIIKASVSSNPKPKEKKQKSMSFQERAKLGMEALSKQKPVTFEDAKAQCDRVKARISQKNKKEK